MARNRIWEIPLFLSVTVCAMRPDAIASLVGLPHDQRYYVYPFALVIFGILYLMQKPRIPQEEAKTAKEAFGDF